MASNTTDCPVESSVSEDATNTTEITSVDELNRAASSFLQAMCGDNRSSFVDGVQWQEGTPFPKDVEGVAPMSVDELLRRLHGQLSGSGEGKEDKKEEEDTRAAGGLNSAVYWVGRQPLPVVKEEEIDMAICELTSHERALLDESFDALCNSGCVKLNPTRDVAAEPNARPDVEGLSVHEEDNGRYDGKSMFFGGKLVELVHDDATWSVGGQKETGLPDVSVYGSAGGDAVAPPDFFPDAPAKLNPSPEKQRMEYIRNQIRMMLLANRVSKDVERSAASKILSVTWEMRNEWDRGVLSVMKRQEELLREATRVMRSMQRLNSQAMTEYAKDPFRTQCWMRNEAANMCYKCHRAFSFLVVRHHCQRCGLIYCRRCASYAGMLPDKNAHSLASSQWERLCQDCYEICCRHQRRVSTTPVVPKSRYERDGRAPEDISLTLLSSCPNPNGTLEDKLPPFLVVLPEEWYAVRRTTASGWMNIIRDVPFMLVESLQEGASTLSNLAAPKLYDFFAGASNSVKRIQGPQ